MEEKAVCRLFIGANSHLWESQTRSLRMDGMVTSVRLENMFWTVLDEIAARDDMNVPQLLHQLYNESIDEGHDLGNFTSFLRVCCLRYIDLQLKGLLPNGRNDLLTTEEILTLEAKARDVSSPKRASTASQH
jgi:predicted DNA-binding ribbon-helix-helix protein